MEGRSSHASWMLGIGLLLAALPVRAEFVYFGTTQNTLVGYQVNTDGTWTSVAEPSIPISLGSPGIPLFSIRSSVNTQVLYLSNAGGPIVGYTIGQNGYLTQIPGFSETPGGQMVVDPKGRFVYAIGWNNEFFSNNNVFCYQTAANGTLTPIPNSTINLSNAPMAGAIDPSGNYFYLTTGAAPTLLAYHIEADGTLKAISSIQFALEEYPHLITVDHSGQYVYVAGNVLYAFQLDQAGQLKAVSGSPHKLGTFVNGLRTNPTTNFLYALAGGRLFGFEILSTGGLKSVAGTPKLIDKDLGEVKIDRSGKFLYVSDFTKNEVDAFRLGTTGTLTSIKPFSIGGGPTEFIFVGSL